MKPATGNKSGYDSNKPRYMVMSCFYGTLAAGINQWTKFEFLRKCKVISGVAHCFSAGAATANLFELTVYRDEALTQVVLYASDDFPSGNEWARAVDKVPAPALEDMVEDDFIIIDIRNSTIGDITRVSGQVVVQLMD